MLDRKKSVVWLESFGGLEFCPHALMFWASLSSDREHMACWYDLTNMLRINILLQQTREVFGLCGGPVTAALKCWLYIIVLAKVPFAEGGDFGERASSLPCLLTHKSRQRLGPRPRTHCLSKRRCIPLRVGPVHRCFTLKEIADVSKNHRYTSPLGSKNHIFCGDWWLRFFFKKPSAIANPHIIGWKKYII